MRKNLIIGIALGILIFGGGMASAQEQTNWTGMYIGMHMGHSWGDADDSLQCDELEDDFSFLGTDVVGSISFDSVGSSETVTTYCNDDGSSGAVNFITALDNNEDGSWDNIDDLDDIDGWLGGVQLGFLYQFGMFVAGTEFSTSVTNMSDTRVVEIDDDIFDGDGCCDDSVGIFEFKADINFLATAVARAGLSLMDDKLLLSLKGGLAFAQIDFESTSEWKDDNTVEGWTIGGQVDLKVTSNISAFLAYDHMEFNDIKFRGQTILLFPIIPNLTNYHEYDFEVNSLKFGLNYHFK